MASAIDPTLNGQMDTTVDVDKSEMKEQLQAAKDEIEALQDGSGLAVGALDGKAIDMQDQILTRAAVKDTAEITDTPSISGGALTLDRANGNVFAVTLDQNVTSLTLANPPASGRTGTMFIFFTQDGTGGRTVSWPGSVTWLSGSAPTIASGANAVTVVALFTKDAGTNWYGAAPGEAGGGAV